MGYNLRPSTLVSKTSFKNSNTNTKTKTKTKTKKLNSNHQDESDSESDILDYDQDDQDDQDDQEDIDYSENHIEYEDIHDECNDDCNDDIEEDEEEDEDTDDYTDDYTDDEDYDETKDIPVISISNSKTGGITFTIGKRKINQEDGDYYEDDEVDENNMIQMFSEKEEQYWKTLTSDEKAMLQDKFKAIKENDTLSITPLKFKIISSNMNHVTKQMILSKIDEFNMMSPHTSEYFKCRKWLNEISRLPLGFYHKLPITLGEADSTQNCAKFLTNVHNILNETVYGHVDAKDQVLRVLAQWITNPQSRGHCIGIQGPMGVGKSSLVKDGISKALNIPFAFIALGGASDGSFLDGFSVTYEGSTYGKISEVLMKAQCMNPIIFFDELDKVSSSSRGDEIIGILTHLTDSVQNEKFNDKYFGEIDLDLSKCLFVFSYNDENMINPILRDRMIQIHVKGYTPKDKLEIAKNYLLPSILKEYLFNAGDIVFTDEIIDKIIQRVPEEEGVRNLRRGIESIVSWLNMYRYIPLPPSKKQKVLDANKAIKENNTKDAETKEIEKEEEKRIVFPVTITVDDVITYVKLHDENLGSKTYLQTMYT